MPRSRTTSRNASRNSSTTTPANTLTKIAALERASGNIRLLSETSDGSVVVWNTEAAARRRGHRRVTLAGYTS